MGYAYQASSVPYRVRTASVRCRTHRGVQKNDESSAHARDWHSHGTRGDRLRTVMPRLLVAVNPYAVLPIYGEESMAAHSAAALGTIAPHIYGTLAA